MNDKQALNNYFIHTCENTLTEHDLLDKPGQTHNVDELGKKTMKHFY